MEVRSSEIMKSTLYFFGAAKEVTTKKKNVRIGGHFLFTCPLLIIHRRTQALNKMISEMVNSQTVLLTLALEQQHCGVQVVEWVGLVRDTIFPARFLSSCSMNRTGDSVTTDSPNGVNASIWTRGHTAFEVFP